MQEYDGDWAAEERPHGQRAKLSPSPFSPGPKLMENQVGKGPGIKHPLGLS